MVDKSTQRIKHNNRIQFVTTKEGKHIFRGYSVHEWDGMGYNVFEAIDSLDRAILRATELGYDQDAKFLGMFK